ncbi:MAG: hypothetical protein LBL79_01055 [Prevotella sp.]|jgi:hypothetical protein|nr:hypothetical protein [Prevotella sp.]
MLANTGMAKEVKVKDAKELKKITVGDSINYIRQKAGQTVKLQIEAAETQLTKFQQDHAIIQSTSTIAIPKAYSAQMIKMLQTVDSLKAIKPEPTKLYNGKKPEEVIAVVVEAKISANGGEEAIRNFVLSPDGKKCYGATENPDMSPEK